ncbi:Hypothetical protein DHA2_154233 [Giardia duodenalis]|uniref:Uncharacterized protein n=1 Tax=Giardia intestinalis TaxID=5741 RepID=V6TD55_GIAIN|nr:Hypothetical protein DHA2_154233 [Giardia intestinalis]
MCRRQGNERGISSAPDEQGQSPAAQKHAQGPEGPSPDTSCVAAEGRPRRSSSGRRAHSPGRGRLLSGCSLCRARSPCPSACVSLCHANTTMCSRWNAVCSVSRKASVWSPGGSGLPCGAHHDRPLIVVVLSRPWEEGRTKVLLPSESLDI